MIPLSPKYYAYGLLTPMALGNIWLWLFIIATEIGMQGDKPRFDAILTDEKYELSSLANG
jgi:hypothetical protein